MNILITGGAGFIGSVIAERLLEEGHNISIIDNYSNSYPDNIPYAADFYYADITYPKTVAFEDAFENQDIIIHCAAIADVQASSSDCMRVNLLGGINVLNQMVKRGIKKIINASSAAVYGDCQKQPISTADQWAPINDYGLSKLLFEQVLTHYERIHGIQHTSFRYFNVVGATEQHGENRRVENHLIYRTLQAAAKGETINLYGNCLRDYIHVSDVAEYNALFIRNNLWDRKDIWTKHLNIGSGNGWRTEEVIKKAANVIGRSIFNVRLPQRPADPERLLANMRDEWRLFGYKPQHNIEDCIRDTWQWMQIKEHCGRYG